MGNFDFLKNNFKGLYEECREAEENCYTKPRTSVFYSRRALEFCVALIFKFEKIVKPYGDQLKDLLNNFKFREIFEDPKQIDTLHFIRKIGNMAVHENKIIDYDIALQCVKILYDLAVWIDYCYGSLKDDQIKFDENLIPKGKISNEEKIVLSYENNSVENSIEKIKEVPTKKHNIPVTQKTTSEKETRIKYIDVMLKKSGWKLEDKNVREYPVEGISSRTGAGKVDYVLWGDDGTPLAVIEAKKTIRDSKEGRHQVQHYAEAIEKKFNFYPVRFCTNGFETYIYDDKGAVDRKIYGFYRKEELIRIISRRKNKIDEKMLLKAIDNNIAGRTYQRRAITKVLENYNNGNRKSLLVMATGAGKTRVAASIVNTLSNLNLINRTLFLADRVALVKQAMNSFKIYLPDFTLCNLVEEKNRDNVKVLFSTYQTMAAEAEKLREDGTNKYGIGAFDLIIVDEAHRSVYQKYGDLFEYFDSLLLGLTATPKEELDRNTFSVFGMNSKEPTDSYDLFEAADKGYLVLPKIKEIKLNYPENGIVYNNLSEEDKEKYESLFDEDEIMLDAIDGESINRWFFNEGTTREVIHKLMEEGYKIDGGDKLGKTIIFARNDRHADHIVKVFNEMYRKNGDFCQKITTKVEYAQDLIERFSDPKRMPQIAVSVDMLDTGIDIPEILNLVFYKKVRSKAKFWQMIGRGTRKCKDIFGAGEDKKDFLIFDFCNNFSYFEMQDNFEEAKGKLTENLTSKIFAKKVKLIYKLQDLEYQADEKYVQLREKLIDSVYENIESLNEENISVKIKIGYVKMYKDKNKLYNLNEKDVDDIVDNLKNLPFEIVNGGEKEKRFENLILETQLKLTEEKNIAGEKEKIQEVAKELKSKGTIKHIQNNSQEILKIVKDKNYMENLDILELEEIKEKIKPLTVYLDQEQVKKIKEIDFNDSIISVEEKEINYMKYDTYDLKRKFQEYLEENKEMLAIKKLRFNQPLDAEDIKQLQQLLYGNEEIDFLEIKKEYADKLEEIKEKYKIENPLGIFLRSIVGLDQEALNKEFANFLDREKFNGNQIELIELIIKNFMKNGFYDKNELPKISDRIFGKTLTKIFPKFDDLIKISTIIDKINSTGILNKKM